MRTKIFTLLFAIAASISTLHAESVQIGDLYYNLDADNLTAEVTYQYEWKKGNNYSGLTSANIPSSVTFESQTYSVTSIGDETFYECIGLTSVTIPNSVTSIGEKAFQYCSSLTSVTIPNSVTSIGEDAFNGCSGLTSIIVESGNSIYDSRDNCNAIIETSTNTLIVGCQNTLIPNSVTSIGEDAFNGCSGLTSVTIPSSVTSIGDDAFANCSSLPVEDNIRYADTYLVEVVDKSLSSYTIKEGTRFIGSAAFHGCSSLTSVTIPNSVTSIGDLAFEWCATLTSVTIGNSVTSLGDHVFNYCSALTSIVIPKSVTSIGGSLGHQLTHLTTVVVEEGNPVYDSRNNSNAIIETATNTLVYGCKTTIIPNTVNSLGRLSIGINDSIFYMNIPSSVTRLEYGAFYRCENLQSITIPGSVDSIGKEVFFMCYNLEDVTIEEGVRIIGERAFCACIGMKNLQLPESLERIEYDAFDACKSLTSITIPQNVKSLGKYAFVGCTSLTEIYDYATTPQTLGDDVFKEVDKSIPLYVPAESVEAYRSADQWKDFTNIIAIPGTEVETEKYNINYLNKTGDVIDSELVTLSLPAVPEIEGFTFIKWVIIANDLVDGINIQAVYTADDQTSAPEVVNPANKSQKLIRNGNVYILTDTKTYTVQGQEVK